MRRLLTLIFSGFLACIAMGEENAPFTDKSDEKVRDEPQGPNHLKPVPAYEVDGYSQAVFRSLIGDKDDAKFWMVAKPSFKAEHAVILSMETKVTPRDEIHATTEWTVEYVEVKKPIWRYKETGERAMKLDIQVTKEVTCSRAKVSAAFGEAMVAACEPVLKLTRYAEDFPYGADGTRYQFSCGFDCFGETWSPEDGIPKLITDLGLKMGEVAKANEEDREPLIKQCMEMAGKLKAEASKQK